MPIYNYRCEDCFEDFEILLSIKEREQSETVLCKKCNSEKVLPLMSKTSFVLKGKGWYKDGYS